MIMGTKNLNNISVDEIPQYIKKIIHYDQVKFFLVIQCWINIQNLISGICPEEMKAEAQADICTPMFVQHCLQ